MIAYFDTSALIPLLVEEPGSAIAGQLWDQADRVASVQLVYAEARAARAQAERLGRLTRRQLPRLIDQLDDLYVQDHALRGHDAVHLAGLERIADDQTVLVVGDDDLRTAAAALGVATASTSHPRP